MTNLNVALVGVGLVGTELISQLNVKTARHPFVLVAVTSSAAMVTGSDLSTSESYATMLRERTSPRVQDLSWDTFAAHLASLKGPTVIVDCTASQVIPEKYPAWIRAGWSVVTANKKGFAGSKELYKDILAATAADRHVYHESSVGAGLPVISTLKDLVRTGDEIEKIEGVFSGTLSYIFNTFSTTSPASSDKEAVKFSEVVKVAKENGYTEPDPRDDLNGMDVARKVTILARVVGKTDLELSSLSVESLVPAALESVKSGDEFMTRLPEFDDDFAKKAADAAARGEVLRYVGVVDMKGASSGVKLVSYPPPHPFAGLAGSDNIVAFTTKRFPIPLVIRGAGAGAAVTAYGVLSDMYKVYDRVAS